MPHWPGHCRHQPRGHRHSGHSSEYQSHTKLKIFRSLFKCVIYLLLFNVTFIMNVHLLIEFYVPFMMLKCTIRNIYSRYYILLSLMPGWAPESALCTPRHSCSALCSAALVLAKISSQQQFLCIHLASNLLQLTEPLS